MVYKMIAMDMELEPNSNTVVAAVDEAKKAAMAVMDYMEKYGEDGNE